METIANHVASRVLPSTTLHPSKVGYLLAGQNGKFVSIDFIKNDGTARTLTGRLGVTKFTAGGEKTVGFLDQPYLTVFDVEAMGYRSVNLDTVKRVRAQNTEFVVAV